MPGASWPPAVPSAWAICCLGHLLPMATHLSGPWRRPGATGLMRGVAFLAAPALKLVWCLFATGLGCLTLDG